jgi:radical SAM superfamily enzyme YgiQ (UPF0313 family)
MRCCLINPLWGSRNSIVFAPPLGLGYIAGILEQNGYQVKIIDRISDYYKFSWMDLEKLDEMTKKEILDFSPHFIGISATTIQAYDMLHVAKLIRSLPGGDNYIVIAGGFHPTIEPQLTLKECPEIDIACRGEGEFTMLELASGRELRKVNGITFRENRRLYSTPDRLPLLEIDTLPFPARHLMDMKFYLRPCKANNPGLPVRTTTLISSRGCPYDCKFCASKSMHKKVKLHSWEYVINEFEELIENYYPKLITFMDDMFLVSRQRVEKICSCLIEKRLNKKIKWTCSARVDAVDGKILKLMREAGCVYIIYGLESGSQRMLDKMNKKTTVEQNRRAVHLANRAKILVNSGFIVNLPEETEEDFLSTIEFIKNNKIYMTNLNNLMPLPGSCYYKELGKAGKLDVINNRKLWKQIGVLPEYVGAVQELPIYSNIPKERFLELWHQGWEILEYKNNLNYILINWYYAPLICLKRLIFLMALILLGGKHSSTYKAIRKIYHAITRVFKSTR